MNILFFGCIHEPYAHPDYLPFLDELDSVYAFDRTICTGDEADIHNVRWYQSHPDAYAPQEEYELTKQAFHEEWLTRWPNLELAVSNHGNRYERIMKDAGLPEGVRSKLSPNSIWEIPSWKWSDTIHVRLEDNSLLIAEHGDKGKSFVSRARQGLSYHTVQSHRHLEGGVIWYRSGENVNRFAAQTGCLINPPAPAFSYTHNHPVLGALVLEDGVPVFCPLKTDKRGRWTGKL